MARSRYQTLGPEDVDNAESRALSLRAAQEGIVLLQNNAVQEEDEGEEAGTGGGGAPLLPLKKGLKLAFIGPHANSTQSLLSNYHGSNKVVNSHSPLLAAQAAGLSVTHAMGCNICDFPVGGNPGFPNMPCPDGKAKDKSMFPAAVAAAKAADVAVVFMGSDQTTEAENYDRREIALSGVQEELLAAVVAANPRTVLVLINGGPLAVKTFRNASFAMMPFCAQNDPFTKTGSGQT